MARDAETALRNEQIFRDANERIAERRDELDLADTKTPFLCECEEEACTAIVLLTHEEYTRIRTDESTFVVVPGHRTRGRATEHRGDGWVCVRKD